MVPGSVSQAVGTRIVGERFARVVRVIAAASVGQIANNSPEAWRITSPSADGTPSVGAMVTSMTPVAVSRAVGLVS